MFVRKSGHNKLGVKKIKGKVFSCWRSDYSLPCSSQLSTSFLISKAEGQSSGTVSCSVILIRSWSFSSRLQGY